MKRNIKKLAVFVVIVAIAMFMVVATASADDWKNAIHHAKYTVVGSGNNLVSSTGFDENYNPNPCPTPPPPSGCAVFQDIQIFSGELTFYRDGTGHFEQINRGVYTPPTPPQYSIKTISHDFIYTKTSARTFTYQVKPGTYIQAVFFGAQAGLTVTFEMDGHCEGAFSQDLQNVIVTCGPTTSPPDFILTAVDPDGNKLPTQSIPSWSIAGILVHE